MTKWLDTNSLIRIPHVQKFYVNLRYLILQILKIAKFAKLNRTRNFVDLQYWEMGSCQRQATFFSLRFGCSLIYLFFFNRWPRGTLGCPRLHLYQVTKLPICPNERRRVKINPKKFDVIGKISRQISKSSRKVRRGRGSLEIFRLRRRILGWFLPYGAQLGKWAALSLDKGVIWDIIGDIIVNWQGAAHWKKKKKNGIRRSMKKAIGGSPRKNVTMKILFTTPDDESKTPYSGCCMVWVWGLRNI